MSVKAEADGRVVTRLHLSPSYGNIVKDFIQISELPVPIRKRPRNTYLAR